MIDPYPYPYRRGTIAGLIERWRRSPSPGRSRALSGALVVAGPVAWRGAAWRAREGPRGIFIEVDASWGAVDGLPDASTIPVPDPF